MSILVNKSINQSTCVALMGFREIISLKEIQLGEMESFRMEKLQVRVMSQEIIKGDMTWWWTRFGGCVYGL